MAFSLCVHIPGISSSSYKDRSYWIRAATLWPHLTFVVFLKALSPNAVTLGVRVSTYEFGGYNSVHNTPQCRKSQLFSSWVKTLFLGSLLPFTQWNALNSILQPTLWITVFPWQSLGLTLPSFTNYGGSRAGNSSAVFFMMFLLVPSFIVSWFIHDSTSPKNKH